MIFFFHLKDFILHKYICKMYKLYNDSHLKIEKNQYLYQNKDDVWFFKNNFFLHFDLKDFIFGKLNCTMTVVEWLTI